MLIYRSLLSADPGPPAVCRPDRLHRPVHRDGGNLPPALRSLRPDVREPATAIPDTFLGMQLRVAEIVMVSVSVTLLLAILSYLAAENTRGRRLAGDGG